MNLTFFLLFFFRLLQLYDFFINIYCLYVYTIILMLLFWIYYLFAYITLKLILINPQLKLAINS